MAKNKEKQNRKNQSQLKNLQNRRKNIMIKNPEATKKIKKLDDQIAKLKKLVEEDGGLECRVSEVIHYGNDIAQEAFLGD